ncbi:MAG TPA: DUF456 domain-containing protein [bacterium]|nr:DUF456 domain-containing protein [bacterium]
MISVITNTSWLYFVWATVLFLANLSAWVSSIFLLPGNWMMTAFAVLFALFVPESGGRGMSWTGVGIAAALAVAGEIVEMSGGAAGALRHGGSRRATFLAMAGAMVGALTGAVLLLPVFFIGAVFGAIGGGCLGAFAGAYLGETWKGRGTHESAAVAKAAMTGHLFGTTGKIAIGGIILVLITLDSFL